MTRRPRSAYLSDDELLTDLYWLIEDTQHAWRFVRDETTGHLYPAGMYETQMLLRVMRMIGWEGMSWPQVKAYYEERLAESERAVHPLQQLEFMPKASYEYVLEIVNKYCVWAEARAKRPILMGEEK